RARLLLFLPELVPVRVPASVVAEAAWPLLAAVFALVVHRDVRAEAPLPHPPSPVLERLAIWPRLGPVAAVALWAVAVGDRVRGHAEVGLHRGGFDVDLAHDVGDLVPPPLRPLRVVRKRPVGAPGRRVEAV